MRLHRTRGSIECDTHYPGAVTGRNHVAYYSGAVMGRNHVA